MTSVPPLRDLSLVPTPEFRMKTCLLALTALALSAPMLSAQDPETPVVKTRREPDDVRASGAGAVETEEEGGDAREKELADGGKGEHVDPGPRSDLGFYMAPVVGVQPRRIAPGAAGEIAIVLSMQKGTVLLPGKLQVEYQREQGPLTLGEWSIGDPAPASEAGAFRGQPLHEAYARITIPATVAPGAAFGSYPVLFRIVATVTDGGTGVSRGESQGVARGNVEVGPALPQPPVAAAPAAARSAAAPIPTGERGGDADEPAGRTRPSGEPLRSERADPAAAVEAGEAEAAAGVRMPLGGSRDSTMLWIGGGALGLLLAVVLFGLRRR
jgi:hypothetical protein